MTDMNAYRMVKRQNASMLNKTYPASNPENRKFQVAGNFYPVNSGILIEDESGQMIVINDRSQAGSGW